MNLVGTSENLAALADRILAPDGLVFCNGSADAGQVHVHAEISDSCASRTGRPNLCGVANDDDAVVGPGGFDAVGVVVLRVVGFFICRDRLSFEDDGAVCDSAHGQRAVHCARGRDVKAVVPGHGGCQRVRPQRGTARSGRLVDGIWHRSGHKKVVFDVRRRQKGRADDHEGAFFRPRARTCFLN